MACCDESSVVVLSPGIVNSNIDRKKDVKRNGCNLPDIDENKELSNNGSRQSLKFLKGLNNDRPRPDLIEFVRNNVIGNEVKFEGPFGKKHLTYCDYTASGRSLRFIERFIQKYVMPFYGNTHTTTSVASRQTTMFRDEARDIIKQCVNASADDVVIYTGSGTTGAIHKLVAVLQLNSDKEKAKNSVVFVGPYEHHSNILPWKETGAKIIRISESNRGVIDLKDLEHKLKSHNDVSGICIVACSAVSNVTGIVTDTDAVAKVAHAYGAYVVFDYASGAPYMTMDMNPSPEAYKDAIVCSPHKFLGGPGTPGLLISKRHMFSNPVPDLGGGGTVLYVTRDTYAYLKDIESREEGGTPAIVGSIRCGMVFQLKQAIGPEYIETLEEKLTRRAFEAWKRVDAMVILGSHKAPRLPIFSFVVKHKLSGKYIHHNFMSVILNDVFGIQSRGGCACAGPYAEDLLGIAENMAQNFAKMLEGNDGENGMSVKLETALEIMKPGFCRLNLPFFMNEKTADFVIQAVTMAVEDGWKLLPQYAHDPNTGVWKHRRITRPDDVTPYSLYDINYDKPCKGLTANIYRANKRSKLNIKKTLRKAKRIFADAEAATYPDKELCEDIDALVDHDKRGLIWFVQPRLAQKFISRNDHFVYGRQVSVVPFRPRRLTSRINSSRRSPMSSPNSPV